MVAYGLYRSAPEEVLPDSSQHEVGQRSLRAGAWMQLRGRLLESRNADAAQWAGQLAPLIQSLRPPLNGADPTESERKLLAELKTHPDWLAIPGVQPQVTQIDALLAQ
jgi:hypothetical protein